MVHLLRTLKMALNLKGDGRLRQCLIDAGQLIGMGENWLNAPDSDADVLSRQTLSRRKFHCDASYCLVVRDEIKELMQRGQHGPGTPPAGFTVLLLCDSSPRVGREWFLSECYIIHDEQLSEFWRVVGEIRATIDTQIDDVHELLTQLPPLEEQLSSILRHHILIPVGMGVGNTSLGVKLCSLFFAMRQSLCYDNWCLADFLSHVLAITTDFGTEAGLARCPAISSDDVFPHWRQEISTDNATIDTALPRPAPMLGFTESMPVPGVEHICHNVVKRLTEVLRHFSEWRKLTKNVARLLNSQLYRDRITHRLLQGPAHAHARELLKSGLDKTLDHRFLSLMIFLGQVLPLRPTLRWRWDAQVVFTNEEQSDTAKEDWVDKAAVSSTFLSHEWWGYGLMLYALGSGPLHL